jgi:ribosomal protein S18 acetylase RimI-like enzyme
MNFKNQNTTFRQLQVNEQIPYELLLLADPEKKMIDGYLNLSTIFIAEQNKKTKGVIVLFPLTKKKAEIKNIAVVPKLQGQGIGKYLIENIFTIAGKKGFTEICIGTANSSIRQLCLYQKLGFEIYKIKKDFFTNNYPEKIYENYIQVKHMIMLTKKLPKQQKGGHNRQ